MKRYFFAAVLALALYTLAMLYMALPSALVIADRVNQALMVR
jgi:hypothetical protein